MNTSLLDISDNQLRLQTADGQIVFSQGYAWFTGEEVKFDIDSSTSSALSQCRLDPQNINNRYWQQCDQSSLASNSAGMRHSADLIWQHLSQLKKQYVLRELILIVPAHYREEQLQLLLGVAKACDISVVALVNKAVADIQRYNNEDGYYQHIDVQLHQTVISSVVIENKVVTLRDVNTIQTVSINAMQEALLQGLQKQFIQDDRFDPLHDAVTEQQLFDQLPFLATQLSKSPQVNVSVEHQNRTHSISVELSLWSQWLEHYEDIIRGVLSSSTSVSIQNGSAIKESLINLNGVFANEGFLNLIGDHIRYAQACLQVEELECYKQNSQSQGELVYQTQLPVGMLDEKNLISGEITKNNSTELPQQLDSKLAGSAIANDGLVLVYAGNAVALENAFIEHKNSHLHLTKQDEGNVLLLLKDKKLFIVGDETRQILQANDRLGSDLADGYVTVAKLL